MLISIVVYLKTYNIFKMQKLMFKHHLMSCRDKHVIAWKSFEIRDGILYT